jgi:hypothetical protein
MSIKDDIAQAFHETLDENNIKENDVTRTIAVLSLFVLGIISFSCIVYTSLSLTGVI